jgi:hypothetical protein
LLPDIDLILTTKEHLKIIDLLLKKCNSEITEDIRSKCIVVDGYKNGNYIETKSILTQENKETLYSSFLKSNTNYIIFPCEIDESNNFLKTSVQYIQYQSFHIEEPYSKDVYTLYPFDMYTLKGMVFLFHIINNRRCIIDLNASYRFNEDKMESVSNLHFILKNIDIRKLKNPDNIQEKNPDNIQEKNQDNIQEKNQDKSSIIKDDEYIIGALNDSNNFYYDKKEQAIKFEETPDIYYSLLLDSSFSFQEGVAFRKILPLKKEENQDNIQDNLQNQDMKSKDSIMKENIYYINSALKKTVGSSHSKLNNMELEMKSDVNLHFKGFLDSKYNIIIEPLSHVIHLEDFYNLENVFKTNCSLMPIVMDIPHDGIGICNLLKYMNTQNERIFGIILLANRRSFIYIYSKFTVANHNMIHSYILTELYKTNGITIKQPDIMDLFNENMNTSKVSSKELNFKSLKELLPFRINEIFYIVVYVLIYYFEVLKIKVSNFRNKHSGNNMNNVNGLIENLPLHNIKYDFSINTPFLNREWSEKLRQYCKLQNLNMNHFIQIICSSIIQKTDKNINIYNSDTPSSSSNIQSSNTYTRYCGCPMIQDSPALIPIYTRLYSSVRMDVKRALSEKLTLQKNAIYITSKVDMMPVCSKSTQTSAFYSGNMRNIISSIEFTDGPYEDITYNIFGIKVNNMFLIMSSVLWEMRELIQFILT